MAGYQRLGNEIKKLAEQAPQQRHVADSILSKTAIGQDFSAVDLRVVKPLSEGETILFHQPPDGHQIRLVQANSDNSLRVTNDDTGNTSAWFYPSGRAYVDLTDAAVENRHYASLSLTGGKLANLTITNGKYASASITDDKIASSTITGSSIAPETITGGRLAPETITGGRVLDRTLGGIKIAVESIESGNLQSGAANNRVINDTAVTIEKLNSDTKSLAQASPSLRAISSILGGSAISAASGNHSHLSVNFNTEYTLEEKEASANLVSAVQSMTVQPLLEPLRKLVLDMAHQLMDDPDVSVQEKVRKLKEDPTYAHDFRMQHDANYFAAWMLENDALYASRVEADPRIQNMAAKAIAYYGKVEDDPAIVAEYKRRHPERI